MVGLSHVAFREVARSYLPEGFVTLWPSEMLNSRRLPLEELGVVPETKKLLDETFWVPQILGNEEKAIAESVKKLEAYGAHGIDINMGCPVKKALRHNYGVSLMGDFTYAADVVRMTVQNTTLPVSVKLRAAEIGSVETLLPFMQGLVEAGASWLTFHPRTPEQKRRGLADWSQIKEVKKQLSVPLIGNGDIQTAEDALRMLNETGCDMAMIGRALTARPWMFWQLGERLGLPNPNGRQGTAPQTSYEEGEEYGQMLQRLWILMVDAFGFSYALRKFLFFIRTSNVWLEFGLDLQSKTSRAKSTEEMQEVLQQFFKTPQRLTAYTQLRQ